MGILIDRRLTEIFTDATYHASGMHAGKWVTDDYIFDIKGKRYTSVANNRTSYVDTRQWIETLTNLKKLSDKYNQTK
jgi:hypothetical protein